MHFLHILITFYSVNLYHINAHELLTFDFLSIGLMMNFLSLKEMFLISLQGNPIFGDSLEDGEKTAIRQIQQRV